MFSILSHMQVASIVAVSFDIFDTLLFRNCLNPTDLFLLLNKTYTSFNKQSKHNFSYIRQSAERALIKKIGVENVTLDIIYEKIQNEYDLTSQQIDILKFKEISLEHDVTYANKEVLNLINLARQNNKKIIITTDIYLSEAVIRSMLDKHGIYFDSLYVSSELKKRKDLGTIFDYILTKEELLPHQLLHLGDNKHSDFDVPLKKGIIAYHYEQHKTVDCVAKDGISRFMLGFLRNKERESIEPTVLHNQKFTNIRDLGYYVIGPMALATALNIQHSEEIQKKYSKIFFSARDGYIPLKVYEYLRAKFEIGNQGVYLPCSRQALMIGRYKQDALEYILSIAKEAHSPDYDLVSLFNLIGISEYCNEFENCQLKRLSDYQLKQKIQAAISNKQADIANFLNNRLLQAKAYFNNTFLEHENIIVFDCGYSGSISQYMMELVDKKVDKIYLWETQTNQKRDKKNYTTTFSLLGNMSASNVFCLVFEELFSPSQTSCIGYKDKMTAIFDDHLLDSSTCRSIEDVHVGIMSFVEDFCEKFINILPEIEDFSFSDVHDYISYIFHDPKDQSINLLKDICYPDNFYHISHDTLVNKIIYPNRNVFKGSIFLDNNLLVYPENPQNVIDANCSLRLGLHIHIYNIDLIWKIYDKLYNFPYKFDLFVTTTTEYNVNIIKAVFSPQTIKFLNNIQVIWNINRGRDVAPMLIEMRHLHQDYDLFAHLHSKKSEHHGGDTGEKWCDYLFDNLLSPQAVIDIVQLFQQDKQLGLVYPPMYTTIFDVLKNNCSLSLPIEEKELIARILDQLACKKINNINQVLFSAGTMFWYRPCALKKLFSDQITYEQFPEEPIANYGTLAHAYERLPSYIASLDGYTTKLYLTPRYIIDFYYTANYWHPLYQSNSYYLSQPKSNLSLWGILKSAIIYIKPSIATYLKNKPLRYKIIKYAYHKIKRLFKR